MPSPLCPSTTLGRALVLGVALVPGRSVASGLDSPAVGSLLSGPLTVDPAAVFHNPGTLGFQAAPALLVGAGLVVGGVEVVRERRGNYQSPETLRFQTPVPEADLAPELTGRADASGATPVAPLGDAFFTAGLGETGVTLGLGAYAPYAALVDFPDDGAQRFAVQDATIIVGHVTAAVGVRANEHFGLGAGVSYVLGTAAISKIQDFGALSDFADGLARPPVSQANGFGPDAPTELRELDVLARPVSLRDATAHGVTFNLGAYVRPTPAWDLAMTYQHGANLDFEGRFTLDMDDDFFTGDLAHVGLQYAPRVDGDATVNFRLPMRIGLAAGYAPSRDFRLELRGQFVTWSDMDAMRIELRSPGLAQPALGLPPYSEVALPRRWQDTVSVAALGRFAFTRAFALVGLLGYDSPASPDATIDASSPDGHRLTFGLGAQYSLTQHTSLVGDARLATLLPRAVTDSNDDLGNGTYSLTLAALAAHLQVKFP
jgi:long-chain fatty acid transport protein